VISREICRGSLIELGLVNLSASILADDALRLLNEFPATATVAPSVVSVPGRVNLIGEHIDYHNLPVLPMAIQRRIRVAFYPRQDMRVRAISGGAYGVREFVIAKDLEPSPSGDWVNYAKAAAQAVSSRWQITRGIDVAVASDLPAAAGLASSSALLVGFTLALLQANSIAASEGELLEILPEGEQFVGTRGGGMDHAAVLGARAGCALLVRFAPLALSAVPVPSDWCFLAAHSLTMAEKSGARRAEYNARRVAGASASGALGFESYRDALEGNSAPELEELARRAAAEGVITDEEFRAFLHVTSEAARVDQALAALQDGDAAAFGRLLIASHTSLRDQLRVSSPALDELVETALEAGAFGARLTGAGFGGCAIVLCRSSDCARVREQLIERYYSRRPAFDPELHLIIAEPSGGVLHSS
jgi:galactokinase